MTGWVSFFAGFSAPIAAAALAFSDYVGYFFPAAKQENAVVTWARFPDDQARWGAGGGVRADQGYSLSVNFFGVQRVARFAERLLTASKVLVLVAFIGLGLLVGTGSWEHFSSGYSNLVDSAARAVRDQPVLHLRGYSGWNAATYVAEELKQPSRTLPIALAVGTGLVAISLRSAERGVRVRNAARKYEGTGGGRSAGCLPLVRPGSSRSFQRANGAVVGVHGERDGDDRPAVYYAMAKNGAFLAAAAR
jgi:APA family basic amino acid/polyamine antiporter